MSFDARVLVPSPGLPRAVLGLAVILMLLSVLITVLH